MSSTSTRFTVASTNNSIGISFQNQDNALLDITDVTSIPGPVAIAIDGHGVRDPSGPTGLPYVGNYFEVYPDHLGNHQRLFEQYGKLFKTTNMGRTIYQTNDPELSAIVFTESDFFTKKINEAHPLYALKTPAAGVFLGDTDTPEWKIAHKFLPPALGPKAVRHYAPTMQKTVEDSFRVFDAFDEQGEAWNVYHYMLKLGSQAVGKLTLGLDFEHFTEPDAPLHEMVHLIAEILSLNKKVTSKGDWYGRMPFGDPQKLRRGRARVEQLVEESIQRAERGGVEDLPLQDAALKASNMVGKFSASQLMIYPLTINRLCHSCDRQQGRKAPQVKLVVGSGCRDWCWIHDNQLSSLVAHIWPCHISKHAGETLARVNRQRHR